MKNDRIPYNLLDNHFLYRSFNNFSVLYYYEKWMFLTSFIWLIFFRIFFYREVLKFRSNQTIVCILFNGNNRIESVVEMKFCRQLWNKKERGFLSESRLSCQPNTILWIIQFSLSLYFHFYSCHF